MNVTGVERQGQDPREGQYATASLERRARRVAEVDPEDVAEIHGESDETSFANEDPDWLDDLA